MGGGCMHVIWSEKRRRRIHGKRIHACHVVWKEEEEDTWEEDACM
jgi:hypothetical protein